MILIMKFFIKLFVLIYVFLSLMYPLPVYAIDENALNLSLFLDHPFKNAVKEVGCLPVFIEVPKTKLEKIYSNFIRNQNSKKICETSKEWGEQFALSQNGALWTNYRFGIFGSEEPTHKKRKLIQGISYKLCREFYDWIKENQSEILASMPEIDDLFRELMEIEKVCQAVFIKKLNEIMPEYPSLGNLFYSYKGEQILPVTIRLIRFENSKAFCLPFHHDISILSLILPSDDDPFEECLIIAPASGGLFDPNQLRRPIRPLTNNPTQVCALLITGTLLSYLGISIPPTPHGVLPHDRDVRYVITACCHVPYFRTSNLNSVIDDSGKIPEQFKRKINKY